jgi:hypothetical protein
MGINSAWGGSWGDSWADSWDVVAQVASPGGGGGVYRLYKKPKKKTKVPESLVKKLLTLPPPTLPPAELQAFLEQQALERAQLEALQEELRLIQEHQAMLLREDEELIWLLCQE